MPKLNHTPPIFSLRMAEVKRQKIATDMLKICTHSGSFHADESLAVFMLRSLKKFSNSQLIRSRDPIKWEESDIVVDVSGKYDGIKFFDHHQRDFEGTFSSNYDTKLSSAGLVFKHFGRDVIAENLDLDHEADASKIDILYEKLYKDFIESVDANDNGISNYPNDLKPKFNERNFTLAAVVSNFNPSWNTEPTDADFDQAFETSSSFMGTVFMNLLNGYGKSWLPAKQYVQDAFNNRFNVDNSGSILLLERFVPWKEHLYHVEYENNCRGKILYVVFPDSSANYRVAAVPVGSSSFESRKKLPEPWRGVRDEELSKVAGVEGCVFIHAAGFIGGAKTQESTLELAKKAVAWK